jgi:hypothetical protein
MAFGSGEVTLPAYFERYENLEIALSAVSKPHERIYLFLDFVTVDSSDRQDPGEAFVRDRAIKRGRKLNEIEDRVAFAESGNDSQIKGRLYANLHWQIGFGNSVVTMTAAVARDSTEAPRCNTISDRGTY